MAVLKTIVGILLGVFASKVAAQFSAQVLFSGCVQTGCGAGCPSGLVEQTKLWSSSTGARCNTPSDQTTLCCPFNPSNTEWKPPMPLDGHHGCLAEDPCP